MIWIQGVFNGFQLNQTGEKTYCGKIVLVAFDILNFLLVCPLDMLQVIGYPWLPWLPELSLLKH